jgi:hypothetical protein
MRAAVPAAVLAVALAAAPARADETIVDVTWRLRH